MKHRINGVAINLRELTQYELDALVRMADERIANAEDDKEKLMGEVIRRSTNVIQLFGAVDAPNYLLDPA